MTAADVWIAALSLAAFLLSRALARWKATDSERDRAFRQLLIEHERQERYRNGQV